MVEREVIGAHYGWRGWLLQRISAAVMLMFTLFFLSVLFSLPSMDYTHWRALWQLPLMRYGKLLFVIAVLLHSWVGVRNIFMDYVKDTGVRLILYVLVILTLVAYGLWTLQVLWSA